jgi:hypothetical protein
MFLNIITPCSRPQNLVKISQSINIPTENYRWIVVFDMDEMPQDQIIPNNCETYLHRDPQSTVGHAQRNFALNLIQDGYVYMNDDDTIMHPNLWENIKDCTEDIISFAQENKDGSLRLSGENIALYQIDSHNFIVSYDIIEETKWDISLYYADGIFAETCAKKAKTKKYIPKILSTYNKLR